ncbi:Acetoacetate decarboxylase [Azospirillaceae bacterium]
MSENIVIGFPRYSHLADWEAGSAAAEYPASNLGTAPLSAVWRSGGLGLSQTTLTGSFPAPVRMQQLTLCRHSISPDGVWRRRFFENSGFTGQLVDTGWQPVWPEVYGWDELDWDVDAENWWECSYKPSELVGRPWYAWGRQSEELVGQSLIIEIDDRYNPAGFIQVGYLNVSAEWQLSRNAGWQASYGAPSRTLVQQADGGTKYYRRRPKARTFRGVVNRLPRDEAMLRAWEHQSQLDIDQPFTFLPHPDVPKHWPRTAYLATNAELPLAAYANWSADSVPLSFEEVL